MRHGGPSPHGPTLADLGEDRVVAALSRQLPVHPDVAVGAGDDCAVLRFPGNPRLLQLFKTDVVVEGVHFLTGTPAPAVGWKALCRTVSDVAAMGGWPTSAVITLIVPPNRPMRWVTGLYRGLRRAADAHRVSIVGGETSRMPGNGPAVVNVSLLGTVEKHRCVLRSGGRAGDVLLVTGKLGGSLAGWHLRFTPRLDQARWLTENFRPTAMMDLSDGLAADLPRLASASGTGFHLDEASLPRRRGATLAQALGDGEDFELLFALPRKKVPSLLEAWRGAFPRLPLTAIGHLTAQSGVPNGAPAGGFDHFGTTAAPRTQPRNFPGLRS